MAKVATITVSEAKAKFLSLASDVARKRRPLNITKNGKPYITIVPTQTKADPLARYKIGGIKWLGDVESPSSDPDGWEYD